MFQKWNIGAVDYYKFPFFSVGIPVDFVHEIHWIFKLLAEYPDPLP